MFTWSEIFWTEPHIPSTMIARMGRPTPEASIPIMPLSQLLPLCRPSIGGKIRLPAPK